MNLFSAKTGLFAAAAHSLRGGLAAVRKSMGWQQAMFGDLMDGSMATADLTHPYAKSAWVRSAIKYIAGPISMRPLKITADRRGGDVVVDDAALTAFWEKPARNGGGPMTREELVTALAGLLKLKGQAFLIMDDSWLVRGMKKERLILARPDSMHAVIDSGELIGWTWTDANKRKSALIPEQVRQIKLWNPYDDIRGLAEWECAMIAAESDYAAGTFARNLAKNNGDRGPFVIGKGGTFTDEQIKQVTAQLRMKRELGRRGEFRAAFLPADVDVKEPAVNAVDSAYVVQRLENRKEVYIAFGVPPSFADPQASYSIGSASDRFRLIEDECMPLGNKIADAFEEISTLFMGGRVMLFVQFDWSDHSTMQQVRAERFKTATDAVDRGMPWRVASSFFRLDLPRFAGDEIGRIPFNLQEIEGGPASPPSPTDAQGDPVSNLEQLFHARAIAKATAPAPEPNAKAMETWKRVRARRSAWEKKYSSRISRHLMDARAETLRKIAAQKDTQRSIETKGLNVMDLIFDLDAWLTEWLKGLAGISRAAIEAAGMELWTEELGRDDALTMPAAETLAILQTRENRIKDAGTKVWDATKAELEAGITQGDTMDELAERVRRKFTGMEKDRALVIAKTETTCIYEGGRDLVFKAAGVQWTQWLTSGLGNERLSHRAANEQIQPIDQRFNVGGYELAYPGDPAGPPKEVINCNCVRIAVASPEGGDITGNNDPSIPY